MNRIVFSESIDHASYTEALTARGLIVASADEPGDRIVVARDGQAIIARSTTDEVRLALSTTPHELASVLGVMVELADVRRRMLLLDSIVENIPLMVFVKDATELRFQRINKAGEHLLGVTRDALLGRTDHDFSARRKRASFKQRIARPWRWSRRWRWKKSRSRRPVVCAGSAR